MPLVPLRLSHMVNNEFFFFLFSQDGFQQLILIEMEGAKEQGHRKGCLKKPVLKSASPNRLNNRNPNVAYSGNDGDLVPSSTAIKLTKHNILKDVEAEKENLTAISKRTKNMDRPASCIFDYSPKVTKQIRFQLEDSPDVTPPPKEFKRMGSQRKTLRNTRCMSTVVTDRDRAMLFAGAECAAGCKPSPKAPSGFVKSMCKLYEPRITINRSSSFNASSLNTSTSSTSDSSTSGTPQANLESTTGSRRSLRGLFRSRSWSSRRKKDELVIQATADHESFVPKRASPSYSTKSQDSGFSDESGAFIIRKLRSPLDALPESGKATDVKQKRIQFFNDNEDDEDPNLTQLPDSARERVDTIYKYAVTPNEASKKVKDSIGNIASLNEGLRIKRSIAEEESSLKQDFRRQCLNVSNSLKNLTNFESEKVYPEKAVKMPRPPPSSPKISGACGCDDGMVVSTPLRASFRSSKHLEDAKTPSKREPRTKLKEMKSKRRWSNIELAELQNELTKEFNVDDLIKEPPEDEIPSEIDPSMVAVWSQFLDYEPSLPQLSTVQQQDTSLHQLSSTQLSEIPGPSSTFLSLENSVRSSHDAIADSKCQKASKSYDDQYDDDRDATLTLGGPTFIMPRPPGVTIPSASPPRQEEAIIELEDIPQQSELNER